MRDSKENEGRTRRSELSVESSDTPKTDRLHPWLNHRQGLFAVIGLGITFIALTIQIFQTPTAPSTDLKEASQSVNGKSNFLENTVTILADQLKLTGDQLSTKDLQIDQLTSALKAYIENNSDTQDATLLRDGNITPVEVYFHVIAASDEATAAEKAEAYRNLGALAYFDNNVPKATDYYRQSTLHDPQNNAGWESLGELLKLTGDTEGALEAAKRFLTRNEDQDLSASQQKRTTIRIAPLSEKDTSEKIIIPQKNKSNSIKSAYNSSTGEAYIFNQLFRFRSVRQHLFNAQDLSRKLLLSTQRMLALQRLKNSFTSELDEYQLQSTEYIKELELALGEKALMSTAYLDRNGATYKKVLQKNARVKTLYRFISLSISEEKQNITLLPTGISQLASQQRPMIIDSANAKREKRIEILIDLLRAIYFVPDSSEIHKIQTIRFGLRPIVTYDHTRRKIGTLDEIDTQETQKAMVLSIKPPLIHIALDDEYVWLRHSDVVLTK